MPHAMGLNQPRSNSASDGTSAPCRELMHRTHDTSIAALSGALVTPSRTKNPDGGALFTSQNLRKLSFPPLLEAVRPADRRQIFEHRGFIRAGKDSTSRVGLGEAETW